MVGVNNKKRPVESSENVKDILFIQDVTGKKLDPVKNFSCFHDVVVKSSRSELNQKDEGPAKMFAVIVVAATVSCIEQQ